jgi:hypothetical protein
MPLAAAMVCRGLQFRVLHCEGREPRGLLSGSSELF